MDTQPFKTICHVKCQVINADSERCFACKEYRRTLFALTYKNTTEQQEQIIDPSSHINHRFLSSSQKSNLIKSLRVITYKDKKVISQLKQQISQLTAERGIEVERSLSTELQSIAESHDREIFNKYPEDSFQVSNSCI